MKWGVLVSLLVLLTLVEIAPAEEDVADELVVNDEGDEIIVRNTRAANGRSKGKGNNKGAGKDCRYSRSSWSDCHPSTNQRTRTFTLKKGDRSICQETRTETRKCKKIKACRYMKGEWSECDASTNQEERIDTLKAGSDTSCEATQKKFRKCKVCKYDRKAEWSPCDPTTGMRTKVQKLLEGDATNKCSASKTKSRSCKTQNGKDRCFYGPWTDWSQCEKGTQSKTRSVVSGGQRCHLKATKNRSCKGRQS